MARLMRECSNIGLLGMCKEKIYVQRDINETLCYYHAKVRDGLLEPEDSRALLLEMGDLDINV